MFDESCINVNTFHNSSAIEGKVSLKMEPNVTGPELQLLIQHDITPTYSKYEWFVSV